MTLDDLRLVFNTARVDGEDGIRAVVTALRTEMLGASRLRDIEKLFSKILASDGEEAAGGPAREDGPGGVEQAVPAVTPAAAPDVCEWAGVSGTQLLTRQCSNFRVEKVVAGAFCNNCGKPISFKEAAR